MRGAALRFAYADPPYLGCGALYAKYHPEALIWDDIETHRRLVERLQDEFPDGWAMSLHQRSLRPILNICPEDVRIGVWVKPFAGVRPGISPTYAWEPVIFRGGRRIERTGAYEFVRDWVSANAPMFTKSRLGGFKGQKPRVFSRWVFSLLNARSGDQLVDLFPGTGAVTAAWQEWIGDRTAQGELELAC